MVRVMTATVWQARPATSAMKHRRGAGADLHNLHWARASCIGLANNTGKPSLAMLLLWRRSSEQPIRFSKG